MCFSKVWFFILKNSKVRGSWELSPNLLGELGVKGMAGVCRGDPEIIVFLLIFLFLFWCRAVWVLCDCPPLSYITSPQCFLLDVFK